MLLAVLVTGCAGEGDDGDGSASEVPTSTESPTAGEGAEPSSESTMATATTAPETTTTTTLPEASVAVPIDEELVARLPELEGGGRQVVTDEAFDERFCTGDKAPAVPKSQARASYPISDTDLLTVAAYRFSSSEGPTYLADYAESVRSCAVAAGESAGLGVPELFGSSFHLTTERGEAFIALALYEDVMWVLFQESTAGPVEVDPATIDGFLATVLG